MSDSGIVMVPKDCTWKVEVCARGKQWVLPNLT